MLIWQCSGKLSTESYLKHIFRAHVMIHNFLWTVLTSNSKGFDIIGCSILKIFFDTFLSRTMKRLHIPHVRKHDLGQENKKFILLLSLVFHFLQMWLTVYRLHIVTQLLYFQSNSGIFVRYICINTYLFKPFLAPLKLLQRLNECCWSFRKWNDY